MGHAVTAGLAVGNAVLIQKHTEKAVRQPTFIEKVTQAGQGRIAKVQSLSLARKQLTGPNALAEQHGFDIGAGMLTFSKVSESLLYSVRASLSGPERKGYDFAIAVTISLVTRKPPKHLSPIQIVGWHTAHGMIGAGPGNQESLMRIVAANPATRSGAIVAINETVTARKSLWARIKEFFGFGPKLTAEQKGLQALSLLTPAQQKALVVAKARQDLTALSKLSPEQLAQARRVAPRK